MASNIIYHACKSILLSGHGLRQLLKEDLTDAQAMIEEDRGRNVLLIRCQIHLLDRLTDETE